MPKVHIHEDDEGMRNLYPAGAMDDASEDLAKARQNAQTALAPGGVGWTDIHPIKDPARWFREAEMDVGALSKAVGAVLPRITAFEVGFGSGNPFRYSDPDPLCFGFGRALFLKFEAEGDLVTGIWFDVETTEETKLSALRRAFEAINEIAPVMIADYWLNSGGLIADQDYLDAYFDKLGAAAARSGPDATPLSWWSRLMIRLFG